MTNKKLTFQQRKDKAKKLAALRQKALDVAHSIAKQLEELGFDPRGKQIRSVPHDSDFDRYLDPGRNQQPTGGMGGQ
jgi:hypothetical protein